MNYEKKYKEAIKKAKKDLEVCEQDCLVAKQIFRYFPELKVNEDELTWLTKYIKEEVYSLSMDIRDNEDRIKLKNLQRSLAWLEKQGNVARLWTIQDAKKGDILADKYGVYIYDQLDILDESACVSICGYQYSDKKFEPESMLCNKSDFYPATKEQRDLLFSKMHEAGYEWNAEKKELKKIALSEEELTDFEKSLKHVMEETLECGDIHNLKADADLLLRLVKPTDEAMTEALRTEYEKGRADTIAEIGKKFDDCRRRQDIMGFLESLRLKED